MKWYRLLAFLPLALLTYLSGEEESIGSEEEALVPPGVQRISNLIYDESGKRPLHLDLYRAKALVNSSPPLLIYLHGGGYRKGKKEEILEIAFLRETLLDLVEKGRINVASINYSKASKKNPLRNLFEDARKAREWLRTRATEYEFDSNRIGLMGETSGAHIALMLGLGGAKSEKQDTQENLPAYPPTFIIAFAPATDLVRIAEHVAEGDEEDKKKVRTQLRMGLGGSIEEVPENYADASPVNFLTHESPPVLLLAGREDVRFEQAKWLREKAERLEARLELVAVENAGARLFEGYEEMKPSLPELLAKLQSYILNCFYPES